MDAINVIYENFGGEKMARIFRTYWLLLLIIKQVMFSLFAIDTVAEPASMDSKDKISSILAVEEPGAESFAGLDLVRVLLTFAQHGPEMFIEDPNQIVNPTPPTQQDETL